MTPTWGIRAYTGEFYFVNFSKNEKIFQKSMFYGLFCSKFFTDHFSADHFGLSGPTYAQNSKNCRKFGKNRPAWDSNSRRLEPKSKNREPIGTRDALDLSKSFNRSNLSFSWPEKTSTTLAWSKIENHENLRGRISKFFVANFFRRIFGRRIR